MRNYLICYYILQQCLYESLEEDVAALLERMSPEITETGQPSDPAVFENWKNVIGEEPAEPVEIGRKMAAKLQAELTGAEKTISLLQQGDLAYYYEQACQRAEEFLENNG